LLFLHEKIDLRVVAIGRLCWTPRGCPQKSLQSSQREILEHINKQRAEFAQRIVKFDGFLADFIFYFLNEPPSEGRRGVSSVEKLTCLDLNEGSFMGGVVLFRVDMVRLVGTNIGDGVVAAQKERAA